MIRKIILQNFQSHKRTELDLVPGVNAIVGPSDSGKTAIIRAINWVATNRPSGEAFRSNWGGDTSVYMQAENQIGTTSREPGLHNWAGYVVRAKGKGVNIYSLDEVEFKAFGSDVPDNVLKALNFSDLTVQSQMDAPFLLSASPGEVARFLNRIVRLDTIDTALQSLSRTLREEQGELKSAELRVAELEESAKAYSWVREADGALTTLEALDKDAKSLAQRADTLNALLDELDAAERTHASAKAFVERVERPLARLEHWMDSAQTIYSKRAALFVLLSEIRTCTSNKDTAMQNADSYERQLHKLMPKVCPLCGQEVE